VSATNVGHKGDWSWWAYPKEYYWFSPQPLPVAWYEFFFVVGLVTCFSAFVDRVLNAPLTVLWIKFISFFQGIIWPGSVDISKKKSGQVSPTQSVLSAVAALTGIDDNVSLDDSFDEIGLVSVGLPVLVGLINAKENFDAISAQDIAHCANLKAVVEVVEAKRKFSEAATGLGTALRANSKK
jgi:acyl carrier protein